MAEIRLDAKLADYLGEVARRRFDWAACNCFTLCADWVLRATGRDPAAAWRSSYCDKATAVRLLRREGGPILLAEKAMARAGAARVEKPGPGDVALAWVPIGRQSRRVIRRPTGAICVDGKSFAVLTTDLGLVIAPLPLIRAWKVA